jgi:hypothetical protein
MEMKEYAGRSTKDLGLKKRTKKKSKVKSGLDNNNSNNKLLYQSP